jgi:hypothetical protein
LQPADQEICFAVALDEGIDGLVLAIDLLAEKIAFVFALLDFPLQALDITRHVARRRRRHLMRMRGDRRRDLSRCVVSSRDNVGRVQFLDLGDVTCDRLWRDKVDFAAEGRLFLLAVEMTFGAVALQASGLCVGGRPLRRGQRPARSSECSRYRAPSRSVATRRDWSRPVARWCRPWLKCNSREQCSRWLSPALHRAQIGTYMEPKELQHFVKTLNLLVPPPRLERGTPRSTICRSLSP